jgi:hypothetical protein
MTILYFVTNEKTVSGEDSALKQGTPAFADGTGFHGTELPGTQLRFHE